MVDRERGPALIGLPSQKGPLQRLSLLPSGPSAYNRPLAAVALGSEASNIHARKSGSYVNDQKAVEVRIAGLQFCARTRLQRSIWSVFLRILAQLVAKTPDRLAAGLGLLCGSCGPMAGQHQRANTHVHSSSSPVRQAQAAIAARPDLEELEAGLLPESDVQ